MLIGPWSGSRRNANIPAAAEAWRRCSFSRGTALGAASRGSKDEDKGARQRGCTPDLAGVLLCVIRRRRLGHGPG